MIRYGMDDEKMQAYKDASAGRRASVFDPKALSKIKQNVSSSVKSAAESASTGVKNATDTGMFKLYIFFTSNCSLYLNLHSKFTMFTYKKKKCMKSS